MLPSHPIRKFSCSSRMYLSALFKECDASCVLSLGRVEMELHNQRLRHALCSAAWGCSSAREFVLYCSISYLVNIFLFALSRPARVNTSFLHLADLSTPLPLFFGTFYCGFLSPWGISKCLPSLPEVFPRKNCLHTSPPQLPLQSWLRYNLSAWAVKKKSPLPPPWGIVPQ